MEYFGYLDFRNKLDPPALFEGGIYLNSARHSLAYFARNKKIRKLYIPTYMCESVFAGLDKFGVLYEKYQLTEKLTIKDDIRPAADERIVLCNYFGLMDEYIDRLCADAPFYVVDNSQGLYHRNADAVIVYSPRKFLPLPDGGILVASDGIANEALPKAWSEETITPHIKATYSITSEHYSLHLANEDRISGEDIMQMSDISRSLLTLMPLDSIRGRRRDNFKLLHDQLATINEIPFNVDAGFSASACPMVYPLMSSNQDLRKYLVAKNIFVPHWWKYILPDVDVCSAEFKYSNCLVPLPIDQRYNEVDMKYIADTVLSFLQGSG